MKTKFLLLGIGALLVAGGLWWGRSAWRARHELVTLDVREAPLAEVLRKVERQTGTKLRAEKATLDTRITLRVKDKPLAYVLKRLGEQAGGRWSTLYAIYGSTSALKALDSALAGDGQIEPAGWTRVALKPPAWALPGASGGAAAFGPSPGPGDSPSAPGRGAMMMSKGGPAFPGGANGPMGIGSFARLIIESSLSGLLAGEPQEGATAAVAAQIARRVNGRWTTYLALARLPVGLRYSGGGGFGGGFSSGGGGAPPPGFDPLKLIQKGRFDPNDRFVRLTPEQRVQRARELRELRERLGQRP
jgi:hypothetical protein